MQNFQHSIVRVGYQWHVSSSVLNKHTDLVSRIGKLVNHYENLLTSDRNQCQVAAAKKAIYQLI